MQIQLCEDDGLFHQGIPQLVVVVVKFDDGKTKRFPYPSDKPISALYQDLQAISSQVAEMPQDALETVFEEVKPNVQDAPKLSIEVPKKINKQAPSADKSNIIEKEDIVTLVKLNERDTTFSGTISPLIVGMDYRVISVMGPTIPTANGKGIRKIVKGYEVIDDHAATPERMVVFPDEVQLKSKRISTVIEKVSVVEELLPCPSCQINNSLSLKGDEFVGKCEDCGVDISIARVIKKCQTAKCDQDVSCFDVGGKYEGKCGKCKATIEVPYA